MSKLFEQLQKAAVAKAKTTPARVLSPQAAEFALQQRLDAEWRAEEAVRKAAPAPDLEPHEPAAAPPRGAGFPLARPLAVIVTLGILALAWYFVPWRTPVAEPSPAKLPSALKLDRELRSVK